MSPEAGQQGLFTPLPQAQGRGLVPGGRGRGGEGGGGPEARQPHQGPHQRAAGPRHARGDGARHLHALPDERQLPGPGPAVRHLPGRGSGQPRDAGQHGAGGHRLGRGDLAAAGGGHASAELSGVKPGPASQGRGAGGRT